MKAKKKTKNEEIDSHSDTEHFPKTEEIFEIEFKAESDESDVNNDGQSFPITEIILKPEIDTYDLKPEVRIIHKIFKLKYVFSCKLFSD